MKIAGTALMCVVALAACGSNPKSPATPENHIMQWSEVAALPQPPALPKLAYGSDPLQFGELSLPPGKGRFPVVMLIHGGCWQSDFDYRHVRPLAAAITREGFAVWNIEYRRLGDKGGGWPNTFLDAGAALDHLRVLAQQYPLDLQRVAVVGHSAGGQLALWLATRDQLSRKSELQVADPLPVSGVIGLAPITDLYTYRIGAPNSCNAAVDPLLGGTPDTVAVRYAQTSPLQRLPLRKPIWLVQGDADPIVAASATRHYADTARKAGDDVQLTLVSGTGHFENVVPGSANWPAIKASLDAFAAQTAGR